MYACAYDLLSAFLDQAVFFSPPARARPFAGQPRVDCVKRQPSPPEGLFNVHFGKFGGNPGPFLPKVDLMAPTTTPGQPSIWEYKPV